MTKKVIRNGVDALCGKIIIREVSPIKGRSIGTELVCDIVPPLPFISKVKFINYNDKGIGYLPGMEVRLGDNDTGAKVISW